MRTSKKWLDAQSEHKTTLRALPACLTLCDLKHDGYHQLVTAEFPMDITGKSKLKAYKGTTLISEQSLPGFPAALESFYVDEHFPKIPVIAVSIGPSVLFYRNMKPYYKYTVANLPINPIEKEVWQKLPTEKPESYESHINQLRRLNIGDLSEASQKLIFAQPEDIQTPCYRVQQLTIIEMCEIPTKEVVTICEMDPVTKKQFIEVYQQRGRQ